jgi:hypothetical protein
MWVPEIGRYGGATMKRQTSAPFRIQDLPTGMSTLGFSVWSSIHLFATFRSANPQSLSPALLSPSKRELWPSASFGGAKRVTIPDLQRNRICRSNNTTSMYTEPYQEPQNGNPG